MTIDGDSLVTLSNIDMTDGAWEFVLFAGEREIATFRFAEEDVARQAHGKMETVLATAVEILPGAPTESGFTAVRLVRA